MSSLPSTALISKHSQSRHSNENAFAQNIRSSIRKFRNIHLSEMSAVRLMNRMDSKYFFSIALVPSILDEIALFYDVLKINDDPFQFYNTSYYDTPENIFYLDHQNGRSNRIKIRKREYVGSNLRFLEIKRKNQKGTTLKTRMKVEAFEPGFLQEERQFLNSQLNAPLPFLDETIRNQFKRITLVNRNLQERCTIDFDIQFTSHSGQTSLKNIAIMELKSAGRGVPSPLEQALHHLHIQPNGFSKYCIGRALLQPELKQNRLKPSLLRIQQIENN